MAALVAAYGVSMVQLLHTRLGNLSISVIVYTIVICTMVICNLHIFLKINLHANSLFVTGALLFATSDSLIVINKFYKPFASAGVLIMLTYYAAQFSIVLGVIKR